jgi:hypothetical protein
MSESAIMERLERIERLLSMVVAANKPPLPEGLSDYAFNLISLARHDPEAAKTAARDYAKSCRKRTKTNPREVIA